jgi:hypothetical protein
VKESRKLIDVERELLVGVHRAKGKVAHEVVDGAGLYVIPCDRV